MRLLESYFDDQLDAFREIASKYESLMRADVATHPVPLFGDIEAAEILWLRR